MGALIIVGMMSLWNHLWLFSYKEIKTHKFLCFSCENTCDSQSQLEQPAEALRIMRYFVIKDYMECVSLFPPLNWILCHM